jgi:hypothetical protein
MSQERCFYDRAKVTKTERGATLLSLLSTHKTHVVPGKPKVIIILDGRLGVLVGILAYYVRGRGFDSRTVQTFVCMNISVCMGSG